MRIRRIAERLGSGVPGRIGARHLEEAQRVWLLKDVKEDLDDQIEDAENLSITAHGAVEMLVTRSVVRWLEGGDPPGEDAVDYLRRCMRSINRRPSDEEAFRRESYLAAIGALGGDVDAARRSWCDFAGTGDPDERRKALAFQGRKIRARMEERRLSIGEVARASGIDTVTLVAILFGLDEIRVDEWLGLTAALEVDLGWLLSGARFLPGAGAEGQGIYEIDPQQDVPESGRYPVKPGGEDFAGGGLG